MSSAQAAPNPETFAALRAPNLTAARFAPVLLLSPYGGLIADRYPKRRVLVATQVGLALVSLVLAVLVGLAFRRREPPPPVVLGPTQTLIAATSGERRA
jgi:nitrate/nitrite transporter NarK